MNKHKGALITTSISAIIATILVFTIEDGWLLDILLVADVAVVSFVTRKLFKR